MTRSLIIGVMGGGRVNSQIQQAAYELGALIAKKGWILLNGGRNAGVMASSAHGAADNGGLTIGILPDADTAQAADHIRVPICTGMGSARNMINVLSSDMVVAFPGGAGTVSEIALALKHGKRVINVGFETDPLFSEYKARGILQTVNTPQEAIACICRHFNG